MKTYIELGDNVTLPAPYAVSSGGGALIGAVFGVASTDAAQGEDCVFVRIGCFWLAKATGEAWAVGQKVYWDNTNKRCTTTATSNTLIGAALAAAVSADATGSVILSGQLT